MLSNITSLKKRRVFRIRLRKAILLNLLVSSVALAVAILALELLSRSYLPNSRYEKPEYMYKMDENPWIRYRLASNFEGNVSSSDYSYSIKTNSDGFRGREINTSRETRLIAVFGDSYAFGQGVESESTFSAIIENEIGAAEYQVLNTGHPGWRPSQEYELYKQVVDQWDIETVVLQLYVNDIKDQYQLPDTRVYKGILYRTPPKNFVDKSKSFILRKSELASQIWNGMARIQSSLRDEDNPTVPEFMLSEFPETSNLEVASTIKLLDEWIEDVEARGQQFIIFIVPHRMQVEPKWETDFKNLAADGVDIDRNAAHLWLEDYLKGKLNVIYVDIVDAFRQSYREIEPQELYFRRNGHTNENGHRIIGEEVAKVISQW